MVSDLGQKKRRREKKGLSHKLLPKKLSAMLFFFFFFFRKWAMPNAGFLFYSVFGPLFFWGGLLHGHLFLFFSWQLKKKKKKSKKLGLVRRAMWQKWVHILMCMGSWDKLFFSWPYLLLLLCLYAIDYFCPQPVLPTCKLVNQHLVSLLIYSVKVIGLKLMFQHSSSLE